MCFAAMKVSTAKWLVEMGEYMSENPQIVFNGFRHTGILDLDNSSDSESDQEEGEID
jgi:hypothetical protein